MKAKSSIIFIPMFFKMFRFNIKYEEKRITASLYAGAVEIYIW